MEITTLVTAFIASLAGGGLSVALFDWWRSTRSEKRQRQIEFADRQIRELYGPIYHITAQSKRMFDLYDKIHNAYKTEYVVPKLSRSEQNQKILEEQTRQTLDIGNKYIKEVIANNQRVEGILKDKSSLMDIDDMSTLLLFYEHKTRLETEFAQDGVLLTPDRIYQHMGDVSFLPPEVIDWAQRKFQEKKSKLDKLIGN